MTAPWRDLVLDQLDFYWQAHLWPRLRGLTDEEYLWEPAEGAWTLRAGADGVVRIEAVAPEPPVPPVTTIAWRMALGDLRTREPALCTTRPRRVNSTWCGT